MLVYNIRIENVPIFNRSLHQKKDNHGPFQCPVSFLIAPPTATVRSSVKDS